MNHTLRDYLKLADNTHEFLEKFCVAMSIEDLEGKIHNLQASIKTIQAVSKRIADVSNIATRLLYRKRQTMQKSVMQRSASAPPVIEDVPKKQNLITTPHYSLKYTRTKKVIDPYPTGEDHATLRTLYPQYTASFTQSVSLPVQVVKELNEIPVSQLYYVTDIKQFAINVNGVNIRGSLGNIVQYQTENSARCEYGTECKSFAKDTECPYYHDPEDFIKHKKPVPDKVRNFTVGSWLYSQNKNPRTYFTRHIGSRDSLQHDLDTLKKVQYIEEIANREGQLIHDLLIYMILNSKGLLERYPHWHIPRMTI